MPVYKLTCVPAPQGEYWDAEGGGYEYVVAVCEPMDTFGEKALEDRDNRRKASIRARTNVELLKIHKDDYHAAMRSWQERNIPRISAFLAKTVLFRRWPLRELEQVSMHVRFHTYGPGQVIIAQHQPIKKCVSAPAPQDGRVSRADRCTAWTCT